MRLCFRIMKNCSIQINRETAENEDFKLGTLNFNLSFPKQPRSGLQKLAQLSPTDCVTLLSWNLKLSHHGMMSLVGGFLLY